MAKQTETKEAPAILGPGDPLYATVIRTKGKTSLVEWTQDGLLHRSWLPTDKVNVDPPGFGVPFGAPIGAVIDITVTSWDVQQALRKAGIWTWDDVINQAPALPGILQDAFGVLNQLLATARKEQKNG